MPSEASVGAARVASSRRRLSFFMLLIALMALLALLLRLGFWQLDRAAYKDELAKQYVQQEKQAAESPASLLRVPSPDVWQFRRTRAEGIFDTRHQYLLDNRTEAGQAGYHVLSVLRTSNGAVLVNRGWTAVGPNRAQLPRLELPESAVSITGRLVSPPAKGLLLGESGYGESGWPKVVQSVDLDQIEQQLGLSILPAVILLDPASEACLLCRWQPAAGINADRHRGYAVQWFSLAAALLILCVVSGRKGWQRDGR